MLLLTVLWAVAGGDLPPRMELEPPTAEVRLFQVRSHDWTFGLAASAQARVTLPFGAADQGDAFVSGNVIVIDNRVAYGDLLGIGLGATLEADLLFHPPERPGQPPWQRQPSMGLYVAFEWDWYNGDSAHVEPATRIEPDRWQVASILGGFKAEGVIEGSFYGDLRAGVGAVHYPALDADFIPTGATAGRGQLFADTWGFAMELRMHFGWRAGPAAFFFGFGTRLQTPPDRGRDVTMDPGLMILLDFEVGVELGF